MSASEHASLGVGHVEDKTHQKSYKRKYKKLRHQFKDVMKRSDELFKQEQLAKQAIRRMQEENTRILDFLVDLNDSSHISKERRHNIGSPSRATPPRFLSPTIIATVYGGDASLVDPNADVEELDISENLKGGVHENANPNNSSDDDDDDDEEEEDDKTPATGMGSKYNSDDEEEDDNDAYKEEIREWNYSKGIPGTPPRSVREKIKADAELERKEAEEQAKKAKKAAVENEKNTNGVDPDSVAIKQELDEDCDPNTATEDPNKPRVFENYRRGQTPEYLRSGSPFLMTMEEEDEWYYEIDEKLEGGIPPIGHPTSPSMSKTEGDPRNPMSVYCWLRKNQPQVFLQGEEAEGGKKPRGRAGGRRKAAEADSGDEGAAPMTSKAAKSLDTTKTTGSKRRKTNGSDVLGVGMGVPSASAASGSAGAGGSGRGRGTGSMRGGRKKAEGSPPQKRQRSALE